MRNSFAKMRKKCRQCSKFAKKNTVGKSRTYAKILEKKMKLKVIMIGRIVRISLWLIVYIKKNEKNELCSSDAEKKTVLCSPFALPTFVRLARTRTMWALIMGCGVYASVGWGGGRGLFRFGCL